MFLMVRSAPCASRTMRPHVRPSFETPAYGGLLNGEDGAYTATNSATPITISAIPPSSRPDSGCLNE
jgi:hypothetical protein